MNKKKEQKIIHRRKSSHNVDKAVDNVYKSGADQVVCDFPNASRPHSYQQVTLLQIF